MDKNKVRPAKIFMSLCVFRLSVSVLSRPALPDFLEIWKNGPLGLEEELIRYRWSVVFGTSWCPILVNMLSQKH